jgi:DNA-binding NtrC family response regulator
MLATKPYGILITDDDIGCRESLRDIVQAEGYPTFLASSGEEALEIVREQPVHLALLDMHLPTLSGLETLLLARQVKALLPAILITADPDEDLMRQAFRAQVFSVIPKPVSRNIVLYTVVRALRVYDPPCQPQSRTEQTKPRWLPELPGPDE